MTISPEPLKSLKKFVKEAKKAEQRDNLSAGEILWGSKTIHGEKMLHPLAKLTDEFINECNKYFNY